MSATDRLAQAVADSLERSLTEPTQRDLRWSMEEIMGLARSAVAKIDRMGPRGTTLCTMDEIEAMAAALVQTGVLGPAPDPKSDPKTPIFRTRRRT